MIKNKAPPGNWPFFLHLWPALGSVKSTSQKAEILTNLARRDSKGSFYGKSKNKPEER